MVMRHERLQSRLLARCSSRNGRSRSDAGFTLVEVLISTLVLTIGLVAMAQLLAVSTVMHMDSRQASTASQLAQAKVEELMKLNLATAAAVQITASDSLASNVTNYFDTPQPDVTRRWRVQAGPAAGTRLVTVRVINIRAKVYGSETDLTTILRQW